MRRGTPPRRSKATVWPSRNASWPSPAKHTWTARPECESRSTNIGSTVSTPASHTLTSPKSTSASSPGGCSWGIVTTWRPDSSSRRRRATQARTVASATVAPYSSTRRSQTRRAVCRCLRGALRSATSHSRMISTYGPSFGAARDACLRCGGSADCSACRTVRRCTCWRRASSRTGSPFSRRARRISSNNSTLDTLLFFRSGEVSVARA